MFSSGDVCRLGILRRRWHVIQHSHRLRPLAPAVYHRARSTQVGRVLCFDLLLLSVIAISVAATPAYTQPVIIRFDDISAPRLGQAGNPLLGHQYLDQGSWATSAVTTRP
jgi:hypothetical protein